MTLDAVTAGAGAPDDETVTFALPDALLYADGFEAVKFAVRVSAPRGSNAAGTLICADPLLTVTGKDAKLPVLTTTEPAGVPELALTATATFRTCALLTLPEGETATVIVGVTAGVEGVVEPPVVEAPPPHPTMTAKAKGVNPRSDLHRADSFRTSVMGPSRLHTTD